MSACNGKVCHLHLPVYYDKKNVTPVVLFLFLAELEI